MCDCQTCQEETFAEIRAELAEAWPALRMPRPPNTASSTGGAAKTSQPDRNPRRSGQWTGPCPVCGRPERSQSKPENSAPSSGISRAAQAGTADTTSTRILLCQGTLRAALRDTGTTPKPRRSRTR